MIKGAIFDFDGTLFDSMYVWDTIGSDYLRSIGYVPRNDLNKIIQNMSLYQSACYYRNEYGVTLPVDEIMNGVDRMIEHFYRDEVLPKKDAGTFLKMLKDSGTVMCIATATDRYLVEAALVRCGLDGYFTEIITCSEAGSGKDEPAVFRKAMRFLGTKKKDTYIFEDALYAAETAKKDGFPLVGVFDRSEENQAALRELADFYLTGFSDAGNFLKSVSGF